MYSPIIIFTTSNQWLFTFGEKKLKSYFLQKRFFPSLHYSMPTPFSFAYFSICELLLPSLWRTNSPEKPISFPPAKDSDPFKSSTSNYIILKMLWYLRISCMIYTTKSLFLKELWLLYTYIYDTYRLHNQYFYHETVSVFKWYAGNMDITFMAYFFYWNNKYDVERPMTLFEHEI